MREGSRGRFPVPHTFFVAPRPEIGDPALINPYNFHYLSLEQSDFDNYFFKLHLNLMRSPNFDGRTLNSSY